MQVVDLAEWARAHGRDAVEVARQRDRELRDAVAAGILSRDAVSLLGPSAIADPIALRHRPDDPRRLADR